MSPDIQVAILTSSSAILGSIVGGLVSYLTTRYLKTAEWRQDRVQREIAKREDLYSEYITECGNLLLSAIDKKTDQAVAFSRIVSINGKIRLLATQTVIEAADKLMILVFDQHTDDKKKDTKNKESLLRGQFSKVAREELDCLKK